MEIYKEARKIDNCFLHSFVLFENKIAIYFLSFYIKDNTCYIDKLDSTGYSNSCKSKDFILTILSEYCNQCKLIYCFSISKRFYVFNSDIKKVLKDLESYWNDIFSILNSRNIIYVLKSNSKNYLKDIFTSSHEIVRFEDKPISKILNKVGDIDLDKLFTILCCRADFIKGCIIFSMNRENNNNLQIEFNNETKEDFKDTDNLFKHTKYAEIGVNKIKKNTNNNKTILYCNNNETIRRCSEQNLAHVDKENVNTKLTDNLQELLRKLSFKTSKHIENSSKALVKILNLEPFALKEFDRSKKSVESSFFTVLKVKRKK